MNMQIVPTCDIQYIYIAKSYTSPPHSADSLFYLFASRYLDKEVGLLDTKHVIVFQANRS
jgi:hypothetical protein